MNLKWKKYQKNNSNNKNLEQIIFHNNNNKIKIAYKQKKKIKNAKNKFIK